MMPSRAVALLIGIVFLSALGRLATAQNATGPDFVATAKEQLTGSTSRTWIYLQMRKIMGADDRCTQGEIYRFSADGVLTVERCVEGRIAREVRSWVIERETQYDLLLSIDGDRSTVLFRNDGNNAFMILRKRSDSKTVPTIDREFRLSRD